jgi:heme/copper-type cytochrome/quinol oxidase subunit 2
MYQLIERLIMESPLIMGFVVLCVIFMYVRFVFSLMSNWKELDKKTKRNRLIFILSSPLVIWFIISINSSNLGIDDSENDTQGRRKKKSEQVRMREFMDSINEAQNIKTRKYLDSVKAAGDKEISRFRDSLSNSYR